MTKIMFVCHGNICRSPMAEFIFKEMIFKNGISDKFIVSSSATSTEEIWNQEGNPVYLPAKEELKKHGISCNGKRAIQLQKSDYDKYDLFVCMDNDNVDDANRILGKDADHKVCRLLDYTSNPRDVADPWYSRHFDIAYEDIYEGCLALLDKLQK